MKKLFYLLALLSVSVFMISCSDTETGGGEKTPIPITEITLSDLGSLAGNYVVDNYSITVKTTNPDQSTLVEKDNYTLVQRFMSHATITNTGSNLKVSTLISNDSIIGRIAAMDLPDADLPTYHNVSNILVALDAAPALVGEKLGDVADTNVNYEIERQTDKTIKFTYKDTGSNGWIILKKTGDAVTNTPTNKQSLYFVPVVTNVDYPFSPLGRYAISKYVYTEGGIPTTIEADKVNEQKLIGGLAVNVDMVQIQVSLVMSMQTNEATGFGIDADKDPATTDKYIFLDIDGISPKIDISDPSFVAKALESIGGKVVDEKTLTLTLKAYNKTDPQAVNHGLPITGTDTITLTLKMMNDGGFKAEETALTVAPFDNKTFYTPE